MERRQPAMLSTVLCALIWGLFAAFPALANEAPPLPPINPDEAEPRSVDWIQLTSGEWIRGSIERLHDDKLEFDSDEFDNVSIDWADVASMIPSGVMTVRLPKRKIQTGHVDLRDGVMTITTATGVIKVDQGKVQGMMVGQDKERNYWSGGASLGLTARAGNTEQLDFTVRAEIVRQTALTRAIASYTGEISTANGATTANSHRVPTRLDFFLTPRLFFSVPTFEFFTDEFQNIQTRFTTGAGVGYDVIDRSKVLWMIGGGVAYQYTDFDSVQPGTAKTANNAVLVASTGLEFDLPRGIEWDNYYTVQIVVTDIGLTNHHVESILSFDIWGPLDFDLSFIFDRVEDPTTRADGTTPLSNDYRLTAGLGLDF